MKIAEIMTAAPIAVEANETLVRATATLSELGIRHLPVVRGERVVGVVSERDLLESTGWMWDEERGKAPKVVADVIGDDPLTVGPQESVGALARLLVDRSVGCAPVVENEQLCGIATENDVLRAFAAAAPEPARTVGELMSTGVLSLSPTATASEALSLMRDCAVHHLPVVEERKVLGVVSDRDVRRLQGRALPGTTPVRDFMSREVVSAAPGDDLAGAARTMAELKISSLPVVEDDVLVGMLTVTDLLKHCARVL